VTPVAILRLAAILGSNGRGSRMWWAGAVPGYRRAPSRLY